MFTSSISGDCGVPSFKCWPPQVDRWIAVPRSETICCRCYCCGGVGAVLFSYRHQTHRIIKRGNSFLPSPLCFSPHLPPSFFFCFQQLGTARSMIPSKLTTIAIIIFQFFFFLSFFIPPPSLSLSLIFENELVQFFWRGIVTLQIEGDGWPVSVASITTSAPEMTLLAVHISAAVFQSRRVEFSAPTARAKSKFNFEQRQVSLRKCSMLFFRSFKFESDEGVLIGCHSSTDIDQVFDINRTCVTPRTSSYPVFPAHTSVIGTSIFRHIKEVDPCFESRVNHIEWLVWLMLINECLSSIDLSIPAGKTAANFVCILLLYFPLVLERREGPERR